VKWGKGNGAWPVISSQWPVMCSHIAVFSFPNFCFLFSAFNYCSLRLSRAAIFHFEFFILHGTTLRPPASAH
jgi:hypothetical protein